MKKSLLAGFSLLATLPALCQNSLYLGAAGNYAVFGLANTSISLNSTTINGSVAAYSGGSITNTSPSVINGSALLNTGATYSGSGLLTGSLLTNQNLSSQNSAALSASATLAAMAPTQSYPSLATSSNIAYFGNGGVNVINFLGDITLNYGNIYLLGTNVNEQWIINISGQLTLTGASSIQGVSSTDASHIIVNVIGGGPVSTQTGSSISAALLGSGSSMTLGGNFLQVIGGGPSLSFINNSIVNSGSVPLPVSLAAISATRSNGTVNISWETAMEKINKGFYIQRNTTGTWETIGFVSSQANAGNSIQALSYTYHDENPFTGTSYYRLQQTDLDGKSALSKICLVNGLHQAGSVVVYPNPSGDGNVHITLTGTTPRDVVVSDISGRTVKAFSNMASGSVTVEGLLDGIYLVRITDREANTVRTEKIIVNR